MHVWLEIHEGQVTRNLLENGLLDRLTAGGATVTLITSGARVPHYHERYARAGVELRDLLLLRESVGRFARYEYALGRWLNQRGAHRLRRALWSRIGESFAAKTSPRLEALFRERPPDVVVSSHVSQVYGRRLIAAARRRGIPTVGNVNSWDNVWKGLRTRPDIVTCWSENNRDEIMRLEGYRAEDVIAIGAPAFDPYLADDGQWTRTHTCAALGMTPDQPYIVFATLGQFSQQIDETYPFEALLQLWDAGDIPGDPRIVLRLHPWTRDAYFAHLSKHPAVVISRYTGYTPGIGWNPTRDEAVLAGNLLRHASVVISPGSTMCIEAAIFETPTIVPAFNAYMPELFDAYFKRTWLEQHFARLYRADWVPVVRTMDEYRAAIRSALADRAYYADGRRTIREQFLGVLDGKATERFADVILKAAANR
jgi:hypothetical protein